MSVYKRTVRGKKSRNYYIDYDDENGKHVTVSSKTSDKRLAERIKAQFSDRVRAIRTGLIDPVQERLREEASKPLALHVADYMAACRGRREVPKWQDEKARALDWFLNVTGGGSLTSVRADSVDVRLSAETERGASARTVNLKLECACAFLNWCVRNGRLAANPLRVIQKRNQVIDRRRPRRVLSEAETQRLLAAARFQAASVPGAGTRPLWYLLPLLAGLRRGDMQRMRWADLDLDSKIATLTIRGGKARRRVDVLPLHPDLVRELRDVQPRTALPSASVFATTVGHPTRRKDFERAGIAPLNDAGHADLHSLRHTFGTRLAERDVAPAKLQRLMRHATIEMTMRYYVHLDVETLETGLSVLPSVEKPYPSTAADVS
jgi:integrase